jgi:NTE family protein
VLGGGGATGLAYHAGALTALELDLGWDVRSADVLVGTSAGAIVAVLLRAGVPPSDLAARSVGIEPMTTPAAMTVGLVAPPDLPAFSLRSLARPPRLPSLGLMAAVARRPWLFDPVSTAMALMADGMVDLQDEALGLVRGIGRDWPTRATWICAVRQHDLRRVVFGRSAALPRPVDAVAASCAVPGYFSPVQIDGRRFVDGGVRSPTNADVLHREELDLVVVVSPMSSRAPGLAGVHAAARRYSAAKLGREVAALERSGIPTVVLEPGADVARLWGLDLMDSSRRREITGAAILDAGEQLRAPRIRTLLAGLGAPRPASLDPGAPGTTTG